MLFVPFCFSFFFFYVKCIEKQKLNKIELFGGFVRIMTGFCSADTHTDKMGCSCVSKLLNLLLPYCNAADFSLFVRTSEKGFFQRKMAGFTSNGLSGQHTSSEAI